MSVLELKPDKIKFYLKLLTEAILVKSENEGSLRKDIWDYLYKKYNDGVDYRDFLLAIRKFLQEGKMLNNEGIFSMHPDVIQEFKEKKPTPAFKPRDGKSSAIDEGKIVQIASKPQSATDINLTILAS